MASAVLLVALSCNAPQPATSASPSPVVVVTLAPAASATSASTAPANGTARSPRLEVIEFPVARGQGPHDVAPAIDGGVWYTAQLSGELGYLDPKTGATRMVKLGTGSAPHGVIVGPDGNPWITDGGLNAIVKVDAKTNEVTRYPLGGANVSLNTATFDQTGTLWFTGQNGYYGNLKDGKVTVLPAPRGPGPYGITNCENGGVYYASLAGSHIAFIDTANASSVPIELQTQQQGARRVWCRGNVVWVSEWNAGKVARYFAATSPPFVISNSVTEWKLPGANPMAYAVFVDDQDIVWLTDFGSQAIVRFDPRTETFTSLPLAANANVRQLLGRPGEVWGAESGRDRLVLVRTR